jgi:hypothetical protein
MPDVFAQITDAGPAFLDGIITVLELRAADPPQRAMRETYLTDVAIPPLNVRHRHIHAHVLAHGLQERGLLIQDPAFGSIGD